MTLYWNVAAERALGELERSSLKGLPVPEFIENSIRSIRQTIKGGTPNKGSIHRHMFGIGVAAIRILNEQGLWDREEFLKLLCRKQHDYGHENINSFGIIGVAVRCSDKVARWVNLRDSKAEGQAEPLVDALIDMVGYAVISLMLEDATFNTVLDPNLFEEAS